MRHIDIRIRSLAQLFDPLDPSPDGRGLTTMVVKPNSDLASGALAD